MNRFFFFGGKRRIQRYHVDTDPFVSEVYKELVQQDSAQATAPIPYAKGYFYANGLWVTPENLIDRAVLLGSPLHDKLDAIEKINDFLKSGRMVEFISNLSHSLVLGAASTKSIRGEVNLCRVYSRAVETPPQIKLHSPILDMDDPCNPCYGSLCESYFPWTSRERHLIRTFLDRRIAVTGASVPVVRLSQNHQLLSSSGPMELDQNTCLTAHEVEMLLSITTADETVIPQTILYFDQYFFRLGDPRFQALMEAFLWTRHSDGEGSILQRIFRDPNDRVSTLLEEFLIEKIKLTTKLGHFRQQVFLTRLLAQIDNCRLAQDPVRVSMPLQSVLMASMQSLLDRELLNEQDRTEVNHWLVSLYRYVKQHAPLVACCNSALDALTTSTQDYRFQERRILLNDYEDGWSALSQPGATPRDRLPWWILSNKDYILTNRNPIVNQRQLGCYEFDDQGIPTRIELAGSDFKILQLKKRHDGRDDWFAYQPLTQIPLGKDLDAAASLHPCHEKGYLGETRKWVADQDPPETLVVSSDTNQVLCYITDRIIHPIQSELSLANVYQSQHPWMDKILSLDKRDNILVWKDPENRLQLIDFPNYGLKLMRKVGPEGEVRWYASQPKNYYVDPTASVPGLYHPHYCVLRNERGDRIVIMPKLQIALHQTKLLGSASMPLIFPSKPELITMHLDKTGSIKKNQLSDLLYLFHLALRTGHYLEARNFLKEIVRHPKQWTDQEVEFTEREWLELTPFQTHAKDQDRHPYACALRVRLRLLKQEFSNKKCDIQAQMADFLECMDQKNQLSPDWLSKDEELATIRLVYPHLAAGNHQRVILQRRYRALTSQHLDFGAVEPDGLYRMAKLAGAPHQFELTPSEQLWLPALQQKMFETYLSGKASPIALKMRPGDAFIANFLIYYATAHARQESKDVTALSELLRLSSGEKNSTCRYLRQLLCAVYFSVDPLRYPAVDVLVEAANKRTLHAVIDKFPRPEIPVLIKLLAPDTWWALGSKMRGENLQRVLPKGDAAQSIPPTIITMDQPVSFKISIPESHGTERLIAQCLSLKPHQKSIQEIEMQIAALRRLRGVYDIRVASQILQHSYLRTVQGIDETIANHQEKIASIQQGKINQHTIGDLNLATVNRIKTALTEHLQGMQQVVSACEAEILRTACAYPPNLQREVDSGHIEPATMQELLIWCAKNDDDRILRANPSLIATLPQLKRKISEFLAHRSEWQLLERSRELLEKATEQAERTEWNTLDVQNRMALFVNSLTSKRAYQADDARALTFLTFEVLTDQRLRENQVAALKKLTEGQAIDAQYEARTGFGKSKVLIPLWLFLTSQQDKLTMMTVPTSLLVDQLLYLKECLGDTFETGIQHITFTRKQAGSLSYLRWLNGQMIKSQAEKRILLIEIKDQHGIGGLALKQTLLENPPGEPGPVVDELIHIRETLSQRVFNFIDESHICLNVRQRYDYAIGNPVPIDPSLCEQATSFFSQVILDRSIIEHWKVDFSPFFHLGTLPITEDHFVSLPEVADKLFSSLLPGEELKTLLVDSLIGMTRNKTQLTNYLQTLTPKQRSQYDSAFKQMALQRTLAKKIVSFLKVPVDSQLALRKGLLGLPNPENTKYLSSLTDEQRKQYNYCHDQLHIYLPHTLVGRYGERYVLMENSLIPIPCDLGEPKPTSEFSSLDDLINFTIQAHLKKNFTPEVIQKFIDNLRNEMMGTKLQGAGYRFFHQIQSLLGLSTIQLFSPEDTINLTNYLNQPEAFRQRLEFIHLHILPTIRTYLKKISGTSHTVSRSLYRAHTTSGTTVPTLPERFTSIEDLTAPINTLLAIHENSSIIIVSETNSRAILEGLLLSKPFHSVIIEPAGLFRELSQRTIAHIIFENTSTRRNVINAVVFYDNEGRSMIIERGANKAIPREHSTTPIEEVFTFIRQSKTTGTDTPMPASARGLVTVGPKTPERLLLQAFGRMRGLQSGQKADLVLIQEEAAVIGEKLGKAPNDLQIQDILHYVKGVDAQKDGDDYFCKLSLSLKDLIEAQFWKHSHHPKRLSQLFHQCAGVLVEEIQQEPSITVRAPRVGIPAAQAVQLLKRSFLEPLNQMVSKDPSLAAEIDVGAIEREFNRDVDLAKLPTKILINECLRQDATVEVEQDNEAVDDNDLEELQEQIAEESQERSILDFAPTMPSDWNGDYASCFRERAKRCSVMGVPIYSSPNWPVIEAGRDLSHKIRKPAYQYILRVFKADGAVSLLALDLADMVVAHRTMKRQKAQGADPTSPVFDYYLISGRRVVASDSANAHRKQKISDIVNPRDLPRIGLLCKILGGEHALSKKEGDWVRRQFQEHPEVMKSVMAFVKDYLNVWPHLYALYSQIEYLAGVQKRDLDRVGYAVPRRGLSCALETKEE